MDNYAKVFMTMLAFALVALGNPAMAVNVAQGNIEIGNNDVILLSPVQLALHDGEGSGGADRDHADIVYHVTGLTTRYEATIDDLTFIGMSGGVYKYKIDCPTDVSQVSVQVSSCSKNNKLRADYPARA